MRGLPSLVAAAAAVTLVAFVALERARQPAATAAIRGAAVADRLGCFGCHGAGGLGGVANPRSPDREIPAWDGGTAMMYIERPEEIREWILDGVPARLRDARRKDPSLIRMPAYEGRLSETELDDLIAYFVAVSAYQQIEDPVAKDGWRIAARNGCFGCHGPGGRVAVPNPGSFKGVIPAWDSTDFDELVRDDDELREWIRNGSIDRLEQHPVARRFVEGQVIRMPAYGEVLSDTEVDAIVAYVHWLRR